MNPLTAIVVLVALLGAAVVDAQVAGEEPQGDTTQQTGLNALRGTWNFAYYEEKGVQQKPGTRQFAIADNKLTYRSGGQDKVVTTIEVDPKQNPRQLTQTFPDGQISRCIYLMAGDFIFVCGGRGETKRPSEFSSGTDNGGEFLILLKRQ